MSERASETQISGNHYRSFAIQPSEFIQKNRIGWCEGNAIKYLCRWRKKNGLVDLQKARHYIDLLIEWEGSAPQPPAPTEGRGPCANLSGDSCDRQPEYGNLFDCYHCLDYVALPSPLPSPPADPWAERDLCRRCDGGCGSAGTAQQVSECGWYKPKEA